MEGEAMLQRGETRDVERGAWSVGRWTLGLNFRRDDRSRYVLRIDIARTMHSGLSIPRNGEVHPGVRVTRRRAIQAGAIGLLGLGFNHLSALKAMAAPASNPPKS